ncbi:hypothetical protein RhiXN_10700 [Rhizoctonia solani]|uniref:Uncharacterized protein n=1 Tax=Rhizoctonia solani TaxID=456999 RepID=A0A8H8P4Z5_9AGAM|nr:uncharacterized protein RhiXN_10700 [Rhizoctonia solani]QRW25624.1 hypothetical protein RhiXN_10700 [Rhizoctonia solani]
MPGGPKQERRVTLESRPTREWYRTWVTYSIPRVAANAGDTTTNEEESDNYELRAIRFWRFLHYLLLGMNLMIAFSCLDSRNSLNLMNKPIRARRDIARLWKIACFMDLGGTSVRLSALIVFGQTFTSRDIPQQIKP